MKTTDFLPGDRLDVRRVQLEREMFTSLSQYDPGVLEPEFLWRDIEWDTKRMCLELRGYVWQERIQDETAVFEVSYPSTWWQHFKQRWYPARWLKRWPVRKTTERREHRFTTVARLPEFKYVAPRGCGKHVIVTRMETIR